MWPPFASVMYRRLRPNVSIGNGSCPEGVALTAATPHPVLQSLDRDELTRLLSDEGLRLVDHGLAPAVLMALERLGGGTEASCRALGLVRGACLLVTGAADEATACLESLMDGSAAVAWRLGAVRYLLGDPDAALVAFSRANSDDVHLAEQAKLASWTSTAHWAKGDVESSGSAAGRALELARRSGDESALAAAHISLALHAAVGGRPLLECQYWRQSGDHARHATCSSCSPRDWPGDWTRTADGPALAGCRSFTSRQPLRWSIGNRATGARPR